MTRRNLSPWPFCLLLLLALTAPLAAAQEAKSGPARRLREAMAAEDPEELRRSLSLFFVHRARVELGLSEDQTLKLLPMVEKVEKLRHESGRKRGELSRRLRALSEDPAARDADVVEVVHQLDKEEDDMRLAQARARDEMLALLTPQQKARFVLFANYLRRAMEEEIRSLRERRGQDRPAPPPAPAPATP